MMRTKLADRKLPDYTKAEEIFNMVSHIVGAVFGVVACILSCFVAANNGNPYNIVSAAVFGAFMIMLYTISSIYHGLAPRLLSKKVFQIIDHCTIFFLIAGTYTPIALVAFREYSPWIGWTLFGIIYATAITGATLNAVDLKRYSKLSMICYLAMGWAVVFTAPIIPKVLNAHELFCLIFGGVLYTIGAALYAIGKKKRFAHSVFHIFVVGGSVFHWLSIMSIVK